MIDLFMARKSGPGGTIRFARMFVVFGNTSRVRPNPFPRSKWFDSDKDAYAKWSEDTYFCRIHPELTGNTS